MRSGREDVQAGLHAEELPAEPSPEVLDTLGLRPGGLALIKDSVNTHWSAETRRGRAVLRRWGAERTAPEVAWELDLLRRLNVLGWPVPLALTEPVGHDGRIWCVFSYLEGEPGTGFIGSMSEAEQRGHGRLVARLQADLATIEVDQRPGWCTSLDVMDGWGDVDEALALADPGDACVLREAIDGARRAREGLSGLVFVRQAVHGDLAPWNMCFRDGELSGVWDFDLARVDHRITELEHVWRGKHDAVVEGYAEEVSLATGELALLLAGYRARVVGWALSGLREGRDQYLPWAIEHLRRRSGLMSST